MFLKTIREGVWKHTVRMDVCLLVCMMAQRCKGNVGADMKLACLLNKGVRMFGRWCDTVRADDFAKGKGNFMVGRRTRSGKLAWKSRA